MRRTGDYVWSPCARTHWRGKSWVGNGALDGGSSLSKSLGAGLHRHGEESQLGLQLGCRGRQGCKDMDLLDHGDLTCSVLKVVASSQREDSRGETPKPENDFQIISHGILKVRKSMLDRQVHFFTMETMVVPYLYNAFYFL